jgi:hypothetical protein
VSGASNVKGRLAAVGHSIPQPPKKTSATAEAQTKKGHYYKPLSKQFCRNGFTFRQIACERNAAIYEQTWNGCPNPSIAYEIIRVRRREGFRIGNRYVEPAEVYPNSETWGVNGFTLTDKDTAFAKLRFLRRGP